MSIENIKSKCTGFTACYNLFIKGAIQMQTNSQGFKYPIIDKTLCNECGLCEKKCPVLNDTQNMETVKCYGVKNQPDIMKQSTSAGVFAIIAKNILCKGGYVAGAVYDDCFRVKHIVSNNVQDIERMRKSKYVQSDLEDVFYEIKQILEEGKIVLFSGTPCQVAGLLAFLGNEYQNLYTLDLFCYGVPSPKSWERYLIENVDIKNLKSVDMRYKRDNGWRKTSIAFFYNDGKCEVYPSERNWYARHFSKGIGFRESCYMCNFSKFPKRGDITIGDWWGATETDSSAIDSDRGISCIIINTQKGADLFWEISGQFTYCKEISLKQAIACNCKTNRNKVNPLRQKFFDLLDKNYFDEAVKKTLNPYYDVMILGCTLNTNYGAAITYYALYKFVTSIGLTCAITCSDYSNRMDYSAKFFKENTILAPPKKRSEYKDYCDMTNTFLLGSDQVWNYKLFENSFNKMFYFDFVEDQIKKIAYASSFGYEYFSLFEKAPEKFCEIKKLFEKMDFISVREKTGIDILHKNFGIQGQWVLDPVFLVEKDIYEKMALKAEKKLDEKRLVSYFVHASEEYNKILTDVAEEMNLSMLNMITGHPERFDKQREGSVEPVCENLSLEQWVYNFKNAEYVVTNSFHGLCMALIFEKDFIIIKNEPLSRVVSVLELLGLEERLVDNYDDYCNKKYLLGKSIDWTEISIKLETEREKSRRWLTNALYSEKKVITSHIVKSQNDYSNKHLPRKKIELLDSWKSYIEFITKTDDLVLFVIAYGIDNDCETVKEVKQECSRYEHTLLMNNKDNLLTIDTIYANGNGKSNCRTRGITFTEQGLDLIKEPHNIFTLSFDYQLKGKGGTFKLQLDGTPWQSLTKDIFVSPTKGRGHYEECFMTINTIDRFEGNGIQVRTDNMLGGVVLTNVKLEEGRQASKLVTYDSDTENGMVLMLDYASEYMNISESSTGCMEYPNYGISIEYSKLSDRDVCSAYISITSNNCTRRIYEFSEQGIYFGAFSKKQHAIVDIAVLGKNRELNHIV